jgi:ATP adenylyltransferase
MTDEERATAAAALDGDPSAVQLVSADALAGEPDGYQRLWTPHRMAYINGAGKPASEQPGEDCPFCRIPLMSDEDGLIVRRGALCYAVLNLFPYNAGHLMVIPYRHIAWYTEIEDDEAAEFGLLTRQAMRALQGASAPHGFNIGMNQGHIAGAGIAAHLHQHVVPRWGGDANFLPIIAKTKALPQLLGDVRAAVAAAWPAP